MSSRPRSARRTMWIGLALVSWPALVALLYATSTRPAGGERWADANPGRGSFLAATGMLWMTAVLLAAIWMLVFSVVVPAFERSRRRSSEPTVDVRDELRH